jgi:hypothetical protein
LWGCPAAADLAYRHHFPLVLTPDAVWLTVAQGLARHVTNNAEALRHRLVAHEGRALISPVTSPAASSHTFALRRLPAAARGDVLVSARPKPGRDMPLLLRRQVGGQQEHEGGQREREGGLLSIKMADGGGAGARPAAGGRGP